MNLVIYCQPTRWATHVIFLYEVARWSREHGRMCLPMTVF